MAYSLLDARCGCPLPPSLRHWQDDALVYRKSFRPNNYGNFTKSLLPVLKETAKASTV